MTGVWHRSRVMQESVHRCAGDLGDGVGIHSGKPCNTGLCGCVRDDWTVLKREKVKKLMIKIK